MTKIKVPPKSVLASVEWDAADQASIKALEAGTATPDQQKRALKVIVHDLSRTYDVAYRDGPAGERDTCFALGRAFVGQEIVKLLKVTLPTQQEKPNG